MTYALGVDIGTSYTAAAVWRDGRATTVGLADRADSVPSAVFLREDGVLLVGDAAVRRGVLQPDRLARGFKRRFGDPAPMLLGEETVGVAELTGHLLRFVVQTVTAREGGPPGHVTLTCPAAWDEHHRSLMTTVAEQAQLGEVGLLAEPVAVAIHYAALARLEAGATAAVYDLGGGTFDAALVERTATGYVLRGRAGGDETVGGEDFDDAVVQHVQRALGAVLTFLDPDDPAVAAGLHQVRLNATAAKEALSSDVDTSVAVILPGIIREVRITRPELETALRIPLLRTIDALERTIASAGLTPADVHSVLLAGGSSRIPLVSQLLVGELGLSVATDAHPKYAVCLGAALAGASRLPRAVVGTRGAPATATSPTAVHTAASRRPHAGQEEADLLAPAPDATPPPLVVTPVDVGLVRPADVQLSPGPSLPGRLRHLSTSDELVVEHRSDPRRAAVAAAAVAGVVLAVVGGVAAASRSLGEAQDESATSTGAGAVVAEEAIPSETPRPARVESPVTLLPEVVDDAGGAAALRALASTALGVVAVGSSTEPRVDDLPVGDGPGSRADAWVQKGGAWSRLPSTPSVEAAPSGATGVAAASSGAVVVVGWVAGGDGASEVLADRQGRVWVSSDGRGWVAATLPEVGELTDVVAQPDGGLLATGVTSVDSEVDAVVLTSPDGAVWTQVPAVGLDDPGSLELHGLTVVEDGLLAIGSALEGGVERSRIWSSADGIVWAAGASLQAEGVGAAMGWDLVRTATGALLAVGAETGLDSAPVAVVWHESAGTWTPQALPELGAAQLLGASSTPSGALVVGAVEDGEGQSAAAWVLTGAP